MRGQPCEFTASPEGRVFDRYRDLGGEELLKTLAETPYSRKQPVLIEVLRRSNEAHVEDPFLLEIIDKLSRCGRTPSMKYDKLGRRRPGLFRCKLITCPSCQSRQTKGRQTRAVDLIASATPTILRRDALRFVTVDANANESISVLRMNLRKVQKKFGFQAVGWIQIGLTGVVHAHLVCICQGNVLAAGLRKTRLFSHVNVEEIHQDKDVLEGAGHVLGYALTELRSRDSTKPGASKAWTIQGITDWVVRCEMDTKNRKIELGFPREIRKVLSGKVKARKKPSILLSNLATASDFKGLSSPDLPTCSG